MTETLLPSCENHDRDKRTEAYLAYSVALDAHFLEIADGASNRLFDSEQILETVDRLQEFVFEAIEAESMDELAGLGKLVDELAISEEKIREASYIELAGEFVERRNQLLERIKVLESGAE